MASIIIIVGSIFLYLNKENIELSSVMGNSTVKTVVFKPDKINVKNINQFYYSNNKDFVWSLYEKAGYATDYLTHGYKKLGIKVYGSNKKHLKTYKEGSTFIVNRKYAGQTFILKVYMQHKKTKKKVFLFLVKMFMVTQKMRLIYIKN